MGIYNSKPITQYTPGAQVLATDVYPAVDVTDHTQSPVGTTKKYTIQQLQNYFQGLFQSSNVIACRVASTNELSSLYNNGMAGVGATLTNNGIQAALEIDGISVVVNDIVLVRLQGNQSANGVYSVSNIGSVSSNWILTRISNFNTANTILPGIVISVYLGNENAKTLWIQTSKIVTVGTDSILFYQVDETGTGLIKNQNIISLIIPVVLSSGGTGAALVASPGGIVYSDVSSLAILPGTSTAGQVLVSGSDAAPSWSSASFPISCLQGDLFYGSATDVISNLAKATLATRYLSNTGTDNNPNWDQVDLTNGVKNLLPLVSGGTNANLTAALGAIPYSTASALALLAPTLTASQMLQSGASGAPSWSTATWPVTTTINQLLYSSGTNAVVGLATGNDGTLITSGVGVPSISSTLPSAVQLNVTQLGTITSGTWHGTILELAYGGSNAALTASNGGVIYSTASAFAILAGTATAGQILVSGSNAAPSWSSTTFPLTCSQGDLFYGSAINVISTLSKDTNATRYLSNTGVSNNPTWAQIDLTNGVANKLLLENGGTNANLTAALGAVPYSTAGAFAFLAPTATAAQMFQSGSNAAPAWSTSTWPATTTINQILYSSSTNTVVGLATGNDGTLITSGVGVPSISSTLPSAVQLNITQLGTVTTGVWNGSIIGLAYGGTNANLTASNGGVFYSTATAGAILSGTATANQVLLSGSSVAPSWSTATYPATTTINQILYSSSNNIIAGLSAGNDGALITGATGIPSISSTLPVAVQLNITQLGAITVGTWNGAVIGMTYGGTSKNLTPSAGGIVWTDVDSMEILAGTATAGQLLVSGSSASPAWSSTTFPVTCSQGDLFYGSASNVISTLSKNTNATRYLSNTGSSNNPAWAQVDLTNGVSNQLPLANGGTNANLTASNGGIFYSTAAAGAILSGTATANQMLQSGSSTTPAWSTTTWPATSTQGDILYSSSNNVISSLAKDVNATRYLSNTGTSNNPAWTQVNLTTGVTDTLPVGSGGTGTTLFTDHGVLVGSGVAAIDALAVGTTGQLLVGASSADPAFASSAIGDFTFTSATAAVARLFTVSNTDNTSSSSSAQINIKTGGASAGDPTLLYTVTGVQTYIMGVAASTGKFILSSGVALSSASGLTFNGSQMLFGVSSGTSSSQIEFQSSGAIYTLQLSGSLSGVDGSNNSYTLYLNNSIAPLGVSPTTIASIYSNTSLSARATYTATTAAGLLVENAYNSNAGTITKAYGAYIKPGTAGAGTITTSYGLYVNKQTCASTNYGAYLESNVGIGITAPTVPLHVSGDALFTGSVYSASSLFCGFSSAPTLSGNYNFYVFNDTGDALNVFRLDGFSNVFYIVAASNVGSGAGTALAFRTANAGGGENTNFYIDGNGNGVFGAGTTTTYLGGLTILNSTGPHYYLYDSSQAADNRLWDIWNTGTQLKIRAVNDANSAAGDAIAISRSGTTVTGITFSPAATFSSTITAASLGSSASGTALILDASNNIVTQSSSGRYKENIREIEIDTSLVYQLQAKQFNFKKTKEEGFGYIAEEVGEILPELVHYNKNGKPESVNYSLLSVLLLEELKNLKKEIDRLKAF